MSRPDKPAPAEAVAAVTGTSYPAPFAARVTGRSKRKLGDAFGLRNFGVNLTELEPGSISALYHAHSRQDEMIYVLEGRATLVLDGERHALAAGDCIGFPAGTGHAHHVVNDSDGVVRYLEIGDRTGGDEVDYPDDDIRAIAVDGGGWQFTHKDGTPY